MDKLETATKDEIKSSIVDMKSDILDSLKVDIDSIVDKGNRELEDPKRRELNITVFIRPFEKRSYYVIPLGVRMSVRPSVRLCVNFFVSV